MKNNFWSLIWSSFNEIQGSLITFIGIFVSVLIARFPVKTQISLDVFIVVILISLLIIATVTNAIGKLLTENKELKQRIAKPLISKIIFARKYQISGVEGILFLLERSQLFSIGILVSCYYKDEGGIELLIDTGKVIHVQEEGKIQAFIDRPIIGHENIWNELSKKNSQRVLLYRLSNEEIKDPDTGESLGYLEIYKGTGQVISIQEKMSIIESDRYEIKTVKNSQTMFQGIPIGQPMYDYKDLLPFEDAEIGDLVKVI